VIINDQENIIVLVKAQGAIYHQFISIMDMKIKYEWVYLSSRIAGDK
jgi:hypothetical protein